MLGQLEKPSEQPDDLYITQFGRSPIIYHLWAGIFGFLWVSCSALACGTCICSPTLPSLLHFDTSRLPICIVDSPSVCIYSIDPYCIPVHGLNDLFSIFSDFVAQMWPYFPPYPALDLAVISSQKEAMEPHVHVAYSHSLWLGQEARERSEK